MRNLIFSALLLSTASLLFSSRVFAAGDPEAGEVLAITCTGCHGIPGYNNVYPTYKVPKVGGQNYEYLVAALHEYRNGERDHPTMQVQAESLSDEQIENIAAYFASLGGE
jgi:cytochrome c553